MEDMKESNKLIGTSSLSEPDKLREFLCWAEKFCEKNKLKLDGFWTYDNDFFSWDYLLFLHKGKYIKINENLGDEQKPDINLDNLSKDEKLAAITMNVANKYDVKAWYHRGEGKIFERSILKDWFKIKNDNVVLDNFKKTRDILMGSKCDYFIHSDWYGLYFLVLAALAGKSFHEVSFKTEELYNLRKFLEEEKPKGVVLSYISEVNCSFKDLMLSSDKDCPINISLGQMLDLFDIPELKYFKLLFVSKYPSIKQDNEKISVVANKTEWVLAYSK